MINCFWKGLLWQLCAEQTEGSEGRYWQGWKQGEPVRSPVTCQPRDNGGLDQGDSNKDDEKHQILNVELPVFDDSINVQ